MANAPSTQQKVTDSQPKTGTGQEKITIFTQEGPLKKIQNLCFLFST